ncbi:cyclic-di-AMP-binding protein CbpB [Bacillus fonticola]|uniref:cyclic-di-AMP-binding protein CbpB n=1 Tax=Bacillus fonticola TaxID=2728853 RepID=UPI00147646F2|nr:cyclic-di-AMP-binding protein CbpB [Bacillus fonticola]
MVSFQLNESLDTYTSVLLVPEDRVAHVLTGSTCAHALLLLTKSGYTAFPVLDFSNRVVGIVSLPLILESMVETSGWNEEKLYEQKIEAVMDTKVPKVKKTDRMKRILKLLIDHPFLCVVDEEDRLAGIVTRRLWFQLQVHEKMSKP